jgi:hypothetical protein
MADIGRPIEDRKRRETEHYHRIAADLAERCELFADICPWPNTASRVRQAASSLRWQINWERKHPGQALTPAADRAARDSARTSDDG